MRAALPRLLQFRRRPESISVRLFFHLARTRLKPQTLRFVQFRHGLTDVFQRININARQTQMRIGRARHQPHGLFKIGLCDVFGVFQILVAMTQGQLALRAHGRCDPTRSNA